ncbi:MAG: ShlB/FhaC/HecB family hemolysin secretion/activation protein [Gammaproteobacteria bacterium]|nr:ShlB/FhaC/HecB family hemolysin secretion/activation protein [Gammaproteobacteria bacterium]
MNYYKKLILTLAVVVFCDTTANAALSPGALLPSTVMPERVIDTMSRKPVANPSAVAPRLQQPEAAESSLGSEAAKVTFVLTKVILEDNHIYSDAQLLPLYKDKLNKSITVVQLQSIVQSITNYYRNEGYILTRAILPPQHVTNGVVKIKVIEGYIYTAKVIGSPKGSKPLVQEYGDHIAASRPLQLKVMEKYLLLANEIPGIQVKGVLEPSKEVKGASDLNLVTQAKTFSGYMSFDNYGTLYIGPNQFSAGGEWDSIFRPGDSTQINLSQASRPQQMKFGQIMHNTPLGSNGSRFIVSANNAKTRPGLALAPLFVDGTANTMYGMIQYPLIRSRVQNLTLDGSFNYIDSKTVFTQFSTILYVDHLRTIRLGGSFDRADPWKGANNAALHVETGIPVLGYTTESQGNAVIVKTSRQGASNHFVKMDMQLSRLQQFGATRFSLFTQLRGQFTNEPLLSAIQFSYGGAQQGLGRGYDPAEIIGDKGAAASVEARMNVTPGKFFLQAIQFYVFYDAGVIFNNKDVQGTNTKSSATSTGAGARLLFTKNFTGNLLWAQPLTRIVDALQAAHKNDRMPRLYFSISASV